MSNAIKKFNGLSGSVSIEEIQKLADLAKQEGQIHLHERLTAGLEAAKTHEAVKFNPGALAIEEVSAHDLPGLDPIPDYIPYDDLTGLNKAVSPDDIYQYITDLMINTIKKVGNLPWQRSWKKTAFSDGDQAINFESKKGYRGINFFLLNFEVKIDEKGEKYMAPRNFKNPYFLTFNQIEKHKGKLNKGSKGTRVVYFTQMYSHSETQDNGTKLEYFTYNKKKFIAWIKKNQDKLKILKRKGWTVERLANSYIPILKYYNVFSAEDVTGIDWGDLPKNDNAQKSDVEKIEIAEAILKAMPNPPKINFGGNQPAYYPGTDSILIPAIDKFNTQHEYYSTLYHELVHSSGHQKRLSRPGITLGRLATKLDYAKEELVAEMGAVFLCAESGILFHIIDNSATYLRGWNSRLVKSMEEDNRFYFRAASAAQAAADFMLDRNEDGVPAYLKDLEKKNEKKEPPQFLKTKPKKESLPKAKTDPAQMELFEGLAATANGKDTVEFNKQLLKAKRSGKSGIITLGKTKDILKEHIGLHDLTLSYGVIQKAIGEKNQDHIANWHHFVNLPDHINNPMAIFKSKTEKNGWVILTELKTYKEKPLMVAIHINSTFKIGKIASVYNRRNSKQYSKWYKEGLALYINKKSFNALLPGTIPASQAVKGQNKNTKTKPNNQKSGLKSPTIEPKPTEGGQGYSGESPRPLISGKHPKVNSITHQEERNPMFAIAGETGKFLQAVEKKPIDSVVVTLDGPQGAGKTTALYKFQNDFAVAGNRCLFASLEEHPSSNLAQEKRDLYLAPAAQTNIDTIAEFESYQEFCEIVKDYDSIFIDSWQKLCRMIGTIRLDEDVRKKFDGKVFFVIFQQTTTGRTKGGAEIVFDGDIIVKLEKMPSFSENYAYFDKNRYTTVPIENLKYMIADGITLIEGEEIVTESEPELEEKFEFKVY